jgi:hypothetical protein
MITFEQLLAEAKSLLYYYEAFRDKSPVGLTEADDIATAKAILAEAEHGEDCNIEIEVSTGVVTDVRGLPKGWTYEIDDHDSQEDEDEEETLDIRYRCPECGHLWEEQWTCACDSECPQCETSDIGAFVWKPTHEGWPTRSTDAGQIEAGLLYDIAYRCTTPGPEVQDGTVRGRWDGGIEVGKLTIWEEDAETVHYLFTHEFVSLKLVWVPAVGDKRKLTKPQIDDDDAGIERTTSAGSEVEIIRILTGQDACFQVGCPITGGNWFFTLDELLSETEPI